MTSAAIKEARKFLGLTQGEMAQWMGRSKRNIQYWESGEREIDATSVILLRAYLSGWRDEA